LPAFLVAQPEEVEQPQTERDQQPEPASESAEDSIVSLMARFETGLSRKKQALPEPRRADPAPAPPPPASPAFTAEPAAAPPPEPVHAGPTPVGHRLRSAIADLQKVAGR
ncbi:MAG TPA: hypothetical protein VKI45_00100, partial [Allosphingosinicella sp.]|nr:hypothetical protein [Allosphingosinicella sp.]